MQKGIKTRYDKNVQWVVMEGFSETVAFEGRAAAAKLLQLCLTLCHPIDGSPLGSSVPGILQARILKWVAISFSNACMHAKSLQSYPTLCDPMDSAHQAPLPQDSLGKNTGC